MTAAAHSLDSLDYHARALACDLLHADDDAPLLDWIGQLDLLLGRLHGARNRIQERIDAEPARQHALLHNEHATRGNQHDHAAVSGEVECPLTPAVPAIGAVASGEQAAPGEGTGEGSEPGAAVQDRERRHREIRIALEAFGHSACGGWHWSPGTPSEVRCGCGRMVGLDPTEMTL